MTKGQFNAPAPKGRLGQGPQAGYHGSGGGTADRDRPARWATLPRSPPPRSQRQGNQARHDPPGSVPSSQRPPMATGPLIRCEADGGGCGGVSGTQTTAPASPCFSPRLGRHWHPKRPAVPSSPVSVRSRRIPRPSRQPRIPRQPRFGARYAPARNNADPQAQS